MKYHSEKAAREIHKESKEATEMAHELFEHLMDIRDNWRDGYMDSVERLIQEWEGHIDLRVDASTVNGNSLNE